MSEGNIGVYVLLFTLLLIVFIQKNNSNAHQYLGTYILHLCNVRPTMETHAMKLVVLLLMPEEIWSSAVIESADRLYFYTLWASALYGICQLVGELLWFLHSWAFQ